MSVFYHEWMCEFVIHFCQLIRAFEFHFFHHLRQILNVRLRLGLNL